MLTLWSTGYRKVSVPWGDCVYSAPISYYAPDKRYEVKSLPNITLYVYFEVVLKKYKDYNFYNKKPATLGILCIPR